MWKFLLSLWTDSDSKRHFFQAAGFGIIFLIIRSLKCDVMDILMIVLSLITAYVLFVSVCYLLIRLIFPKIEVNDGEVEKPVKTRHVKRYGTTRTMKKRKNLAY